MTSGINPQDTDIPVGSNSQGLGASGDSGASDKSVETPEVDDDKKWLDLVQQNYESAISYQNSSLSDEWQRNLDHWNSNHYRRSAYNTTAFKGRSALFRPLSRASERSSGASAAAAFFSNKDVINVTAVNPSKKTSVIAAKWMQNILQWRLRHSLNWYLNCMGAWQNTRVYGPCISIMDWNYDEEEIEVEVDEPVTGILRNLIPGRFKKKHKKEKVVVTDQPVLHLIPCENVLYDSGADWVNPVQDSPYLIILFPMFAGDVLSKMDGDKPEWKLLSLNQILSASREVQNTIRRAREGEQKIDSKDNQEGNENQVVWPRLCFIRSEGVDYVFWTLGNEFMLTKPMPTVQKYKMKIRPVVQGCSIIETHQTSPSSPIKLIAPLQEHVNDISNLRMDNVRLALNKRYILRRGAVIDLEALMRSVPGGAIATDDPERDIKVIQTPDVTASSYKEQERLESESNDLFGTFLGGSVQNNRAMRETVGGMEMVKEGKSALTEFDLMTFAETYAKPVLQMLMKFIQVWETDEAIMEMAWDQTMTDLPPELRLEETGDVTKDAIQAYMMENEMFLEVNVGIGATSPQKKIDTLMYPISIIGQANPDYLKKLNWTEVYKEVMSISSQGDGSRFIQEEEEVTEADVEAAHQQGVQEGTNADKMARIEMEERVAMEKLRLEESLRKEEIAIKYNISKEALVSLMAREQVKSKDRRDIAAGNLSQKNRELSSKEQGKVDSGI